MFCILSAWVGKPGKNEERKHSSLLSRIHNKAFITNNKGPGVSLIAHWWDTYSACAKLWALHPEPQGRKQEGKLPKLQQTKGQSCCLVREASALARSTAPGEGYGRCWKRGPAAVVSAPVLASFLLGSPVDHVPLGNNRELEDRKRV